MTRFEKEVFVAIPLKNPDTKAEFWAILCDLRVPGDLKESSNR